MLTAVLIDDEDAARTVIRTFLTEFRPHVKIIGEASSVQEGKEVIAQLNPDIVFLDIQMPDGTGFDLLEDIENLSSKIIFTTAFDDFALKAFEFQAIDYLLKPIDPLQLERAVDKVKTLHEQQLYNLRLTQMLEMIQEKTINKLSISTAEGWIFLKLEDIVRLSSSGGYTTFFMEAGEKHMVARTIKDYEALLPEEQFFRVHQSHIVNIQYVKKVLKEDGGMVQMEDQAKIPISRRKKDAFIALMTDQSL